MLHLEGDPSESFANRHCTQTPKTVKRQRDAVSPSSRSTVRCARATKIDVKHQRSHATCTATSRTCTCDRSIMAQDQTDNDTGRDGSPRDAQPAQYRSRDSPMQDQGMYLKQSLPVRPGQVIDVHAAQNSVLDFTCKDRTAVEER